jgi:hypothetical protein
MLWWFPDIIAGGGMFHNLLASKIGYAVCAIALTGILGSSAFAAEVVATPLASIQSEFNDNVLFSRESIVSDWVNRLGAGINLSRNTARLGLEAFSFLEAERFLEETELDTENWRLGVEGRHRFTRRLRFQGHVSITRDTTLETEIEEIGVVGTRDGRTRYQARGSFAFRMTERTRLNGAYSFFRSDFDGEENLGVDAHSIRAFSAYRVYDGRGVIRAGGTLRGSFSDARDRYSILPFLGYFYQFSEILEFRGEGGFRFTTWDFSDTRREDDQTEGGWVDVSLIRQLETVGGQLGYRRDLATKSTGEDLLVDKFYLELQYRPVYRWIFGLEGNLFFTREEGGGDTQEDTRFFELVSTLTYRLTENADLVFGYSYARENEEAVPAGVGAVAERNRVWLQVQFKFPRVL